MMSSSILDLPFGVLLGTVSKRRRSAFRMGRLEIEIVEEHVMRVPGIPMFGQILNLSGRVEPIDEAVDVRVVATPMGLRAHRVLTDDVAAVGKHDDVLVSDRRDVVGVDAGVDLLLRGVRSRAGQNRIDRGSAFVFGLSLFTDER